MALDKNEKVLTMYTHNKSLVKDTLQNAAFVILQRVLLQYFPETKLF